jgi:hypothetical protein
MMLWGTPSQPPRRLVRDHVGDEPVAESLLERGEASRLTVGVAGEPVGQHGEILGVQSPLRGDHLGLGDEGAGRVVQRQRRLRHDRCEHGWLEHHPEREVPREAHPDRADARTAAAVVGVRGQLAQPGDHRAGLACGERLELAPDTARPHGLDRQLERRSHAVPAEQARQPDGEPGVPDPASEAGDVWGDPGHLGHHHDRGPGPRHVHGLGLTSEGELLASEIVERVVDAGGVTHDAALR